MRNRIEIPLGIYGITGETFSHGKSNLDCVKEMIAGGIKIIQYRDKTKTFLEKYQEALEIAKLCKENQVTFIVNDHVDLAILVDADGVHLGQDDLPVSEVRKILGNNKIIGLSTHSPEQGLAALQDFNVDYIGVGPIFPTTTKDTKPVGLEYLDFALEHLPIPFVAIGGIHEHNLHEIVKRKVKRMCMVSGIVGADNITETVKKLSFLLSENSSKRKTVLSIAGSDCSGGAGIQADLKTMLANGVYGMTAITALTAQNTLGVYDIMEVSPSFLETQLEAIFSDIYPDAIKIGMLSSTALIDVIYNTIKKYPLSNIVLDPVMVATSGAKLISEEAVLQLQEKLFPLAKLITPNIPEAEILSGIQIHSREDMEKAAKKIGNQYQCSVLCKGGHFKNDANDVLYHQGMFEWFEGKKINNSNTHGTGCTLSSAIASYLAQEDTLEESIQKAKTYISASLESQLNLGKGNGPLDHGATIK